MTGYNLRVQLRALPGGDLVEKGLRDLADGRETLEALLVAIGEPRLRRLISFERAAECVIDDD